MLVTMEELEIKNNERIAKEIWSGSLQRSRRFFGWLPDLNSIKVITNGTSFYLCKIKSWVMIQYQRNVNAFMVTFKPDHEGNEVVYYSVSLDKLEPTIDANVRYGTIHYNRICSELGLIPKVAV